MNNRGQGIIEYSFIIGLVVIALSAMQVYVRRGIQAGIKIAADELTEDIGGQQAAEETDLDKGRKENSVIHTVTGGVAQDTAVLSKGATQRIRLFTGGKQKRDFYKTSTSWGEATYEIREE